MVAGSGMVSTFTALARRLKEAGRQWSEDVRTRARGHAKQVDGFVETLRAALGVAPLPHRPSLPALANPSLHIESVHIESAVVDHSPNCTCSGTCTAQRADDSTPSVVSAPCVSNQDVEGEASMLADRLALHTKHQLAILERVFDKSHRDPTSCDPRAIRKARAAARRLIEFGELFAFESPARLAGGAESAFEPDSAWVGELSRLTSVLGHVRHLDELHGELQRRHTLSSDPRQRMAMELLIETVLADREVIRDEARRVLDELDAHQLEAAVRATTERVAGRIRTHQDVSTFVARTLETRVDLALRRALTSKHVDGEFLQRLRLEIRALRYGVELLAPVLANEGRPLREPLKELQRGLGHSVTTLRLAELAAAQQKAWGMRGYVQLGVVFQCLCRQFAQEAQHAREQIFRSVEAIHTHRWVDFTRAALPRLALAPSSQIT